jgi:regulatory protein YycH of two-component signal transduction system YycFG
MYFNIKNYLKNNHIRINIEEKKKAYRFANESMKQDTSSIVKVVPAGQSYISLLGHKHKSKENGSF